MWEPLSGSVYFRSLYIEEHILMKIFLWDGNCVCSGENKQPIIQRLVDFLMAKLPPHDFNQCAAKHNAPLVFTRA